MMKNTAIIAMFCVALLHPAVLAEEGVTIVTPVPEEGPAFDRERSEYVIDKATLESDQVVDGVEAASKVPGVTLQRTNRGAGTPIIRGFFGPQNLIFIDDVRFNLSTFRTGPNQYAALSDPLGMEAVALTLGPGAVRYGSGAMGGVLRYQSESLSAEEGLSGRFVGRLASADGAFSGGLKLGARSGPLAGWLAGSIQHHGALRTGQGGSVPLSGFERASWRAKLGVDLGEDWVLRSAYLGTRLYGAYRVDKLAKGEVRRYDNDDHLAYLALVREASSGTLRDLRVTLSYHHLDDRVTRYGCGTAPGGGVADLSACVARDEAAVERTRENLDVVDAIGLRSSAELRWLEERLVLHTGLEGRLEHIASEGSDSRSPGTLRGTFSDGSIYASADIFAQLEGRPYIDPGVFELVLTGGARLGAIFAQASDVPGLGEVDYMHLSPAFSAGVRGLFFNRLNLFATFHEGVRAPNLQETTALGDTGNFFEVPNDALGVERADSIELGLRAHLGWIQAQALYFHTWVSDAIVRSEVEGAQALYPEAGDATVMQRVNAELAQLDGLELGLQSGAIYGLSAFADLAWLQSDVERADGSVEPGRRIPPLQGRAGLRFESEVAETLVSASFRWAAAQARLSSGDRKDLRICADPERPFETLGEACEGTEGWATIDLHAGLSPKPGMRINLAIVNLLDVRYREHGSGYDAPGIDVRLSLSVDL